MSFATTLAKLNEMIEFGTQLIQENVGFDNYLDGMIQKFFPEADLNVIKKMYRWAMYPNLDLITVDDLKKMEIDIRTKAFKKQVADTIVGQNELDDFNNINRLITNTQQFGYVVFKPQFRKDKHWNDGKWNTLIRLIVRAAGFLTLPPHNQYAYSQNVSSHARFTDAIHSIWSSNYKQQPKSNDNAHIKMFEAKLASCESGFKTIQYRMNLDTQRFNEDKEVLNKQMKQLYQQRDVDKLEKFIGDSQEKIENRLHTLECSPKDLKHELNSLRKDIESMKMPNQRFIELNDQVQSLTTELSNLRDEKNKLEVTVEQLTWQASIAIDELRDELKQSTTPTHEYVKRIETIPIYDYELIKARRRLMHQEYKTAFKFFKQLIQLRYETPVAVLVLK